MQDITTEFWQLLNLSSTIFERLLVYELRNSEFCLDFFVKVKNSNFQKTDFSKNSNVQKIQIFKKFKFS